MTSQKYDVCIVGGLGQVGLPLGICLAQVGKTVVFYESDPQAIATVAQGQSLLGEENGEVALQELLGHTLTLSSDRQAIADSYFVVVVIDLPRDELLNPKFTLFQQFLDGIMDLLRDEQHIILRGTVFPGTTVKIKGYLESKGKFTKVSFCPERTAGGKAMMELSTLPQIVASCDDIAWREVKDLFCQFADEVLCLTPTEAELAKLFANPYHYIQFSTSNYFYRVTTEHKPNFQRIYHAVTYRYPQAQNFPKLNLATHLGLLENTLPMTSYQNHGFSLLEGVTFANSSSHP